MRPRHSALIVDYEYDMRCTEPALTGILIVLLLSICGTLHAGAAPQDIARPYGWEAGLVNSPDHLGITVRTPANDGIFNTFTLTAEMRNVLSGRETAPGVKFIFQHNRAIAGGMMGGQYPWMLYAGPGVTCGYVRDLSPVYGLMAGVCGNIGIRTGFMNNLSLAAEFQGDIAFIIRDISNPSMSMYRTGVYRCWIPVLRIAYAF